MGADRCGRGAPVSSPRLLGNNVSHVLRSRGRLSLAPERGPGRGLDSRTPGRGQHRPGVQSKRRPMGGSAIVSSQSAFAPGLWRVLGWFWPCSIRGVWTPAHSLEVKKTKVKSPRAWGWLGALGSQVAGMPLSPPPPPPGTSAP